MSSFIPVFDEMVNEMRAKGIPRDKAEAAAREHLGVNAPEMAVERTRENVLEKAEQAEIRKRFIVCGFSVYNLSQPRKTKQTPGLPDLYLVHRDRSIAFWWEVKRQHGGRLSAAQAVFAAECLRCNVGYGCGDRYDAERYLVSKGLAWITDGGTLEPVRER